MISKEDIYTFIDSNHRNKKIDEEEHDFTRLGKGNRGFVVGFNLLDRRFNKTFPVALKTIKIKNDDTEQIKNEIKAIQDFSQKYPYSSLCYLTCFKEFKTKRIFILTERLQYNLKNMNWKKKLQNFTQAQYIEMFLQMAQSLLNLHKMGYYHKSIKQVNWMTQPGFYSIPKLIDFGRAVYYQNKEDRVFMSETTKDTHKLGEVFSKVNKFNKDNSQIKTKSEDLQLLQAKIKVFMMV